MKIIFRLSLFLLLIFAIKCNECPRGWVRVLNKCYYKLPVLATREETQKFCNELKADLPSITSELENLMVTAMTPGASSWLSAVKLPTTKHFKWSGSNDLAFTKWAHNQPSSKSGSSSCVITKDGFWSAVSCDSQHYVTCQLDIDYNTLSKHIQCEDGWLRFQDKCFITNEVNTKVIDNELQCRKVGATMVTIHSELENAFIDAITNRETFYWLGGHRAKVGSPRFEWFDGTRFDYTKWDTRDHEPRYGNQPERFENNTCIFNGYWHDCGYAHDRYPHLCQKYISDIHENTRNDVIDVRVASGILQNNTLFEGSTPRD